MGISFTNENSTHEILPTLKNKRHVKIYWVTPKSSTYTGNTLFYCKNIASYNLQYWDLTIVVQQSKFCKLQGDVCDYFSFITAIQEYVSPLDWTIQLCCHLSQACNSITNKGKPSCNSNLNNTNCLIMITWPDHYTSVFKRTQV